MLELKELREKQARLVTQARSLLADIKSDTPAERAAELETQHDAAMTEYDALEVRAAKLEKLIAAERSMNAGDDRRPRGEDRSTDQDRERSAGQDDAEQRALFGRVMQFGAADLSQEDRAAIGSLRANLTPEMRAQAVGTSGAGGYLVPTTQLGEITKTMALWGPMLDPAVVRVVNTTSGGPLQWPTVNDTANTGEDHVENTPATDQDVVFGQRQLGAYVFDSGIVKVSIELLQDAGYDVQALLNELFGERLARRANTRLTIGTGVGQTQGIVVGSALGKTAVSATAIAADELIDMFHSVDPAYRGAPKAGWQMNDTTLAAVRKLKDGQGNYLWQMGDIRAGTPATLLSKPVAINQAMANIATGTKPIIFGDMGKFIVRQVRDFTVLRLNERFAEALQVGFMAYNRLDGLLSDGSAVKHYKMA